MSWIDRPIQPPTVVLIDWHLEDGCMARTVGCE